MEDIPRTPHGRWEKIGFWLLVFPVLPALILTDIFEALGIPFWGSIFIVLVLLATGAYLISLPIRAERSRRLASDLENGIFDCAFRFPGSAPGSLRDLWEYGAGQLDSATFRFQTRTGDEQDSPSGRVKTFPNAAIASEVEPPARNLQGWTRNWKYLHLQTDKGLIQLAASEPACTFIEAKLTAKRRATNVIDSDRDAS